MGKSVIQVNSDEMAAISCPECTYSKNVPVGGLKKKRPIQVKCECGARFPVVLEFRQQNRKLTDLDGYYVRKELYRDFDKSEKRPQVKTNCRVKNISRNGVGFTRLSKQQVAEGNSVWLQFTLDDRKQSTITREVVVKSVRDDMVGCQFVPRVCGIEPELGFYLMKN